MATELAFYPHEGQLNAAKIPEKIEVITVAAEKYIGIALDDANSIICSTGSRQDDKVGLTPKDITATFNWDELGKLLRQIRSIPETSPENRTKKGGYLEKLAEIYEMLRAANMPKLEAVRMALVNEAKALKG